MCYKLRRAGIILKLDMRKKRKILLTLLTILFLYSCNSVYEPKNDSEYDGEAFKRKLVKDVNAYFEHSKIRDLTKEFEENLKNNDSLYLISKYPATKIFFLFQSEAPKDYIESAADLKNFPISVLEGMNLLILKSAQGFIGYIYIKDKVLSCNSIIKTKFEKDELSQFIIIKKIGDETSSHELVMI